MKIIKGIYIGMSISILLPLTLLTLPLWFPISKIINKNCDPLFYFLNKNRLLDTYTSN
jgi:hypothetical protein